MSEWNLTRSEGFMEESIESIPLDIWNTIKQFYHATKKVVNILVGSNCDAAAGSLTLMSLLKSSLITFSVHPISSYEELREMVRSFHEAQGLTTSKTDDLFILVGLGGALPLEEYFDFTRQVVILLDSHRPIHLKTLRLALEGGNRLHIWGLPRIQEAVDVFFHRLATLEARKRHRRAQHGVARKRRVVEARQNDEDSGENVNDGLGDEDDEKEVEEDEREEDEENDGMSFLDVEESDSDGTDTENPEERPAVRMVNWINREEISPSAEKMYEATCGGCRSCALEVYELSILLNRMNTTFLWHAAVGICDLYYRSCIDYGTYLVEMRPLHDAVALQHGTPQPRVSGQYLSSDEVSKGRFGVFSELCVNTLHTRKETSSKALRLKSIEQPHIFLLQHISLWNALWHDPVISSSLGLYHFETGERKLKFLLAKCGVSLEMAHRPWHEISKEERDYSIRLIQQELKTVISGSSLSSFCSPNLSLRTISRASGFSRDVTALDVCVLFEGTLAACPADDMYVLHEETDPDAGTVKRGGEEYENICLRRVAGKLEEFHRSQFWKAHALIDMDPTRKEFNVAIAGTLHLNHRIGDAASALMQPSLILSTQALHYIQLSDPARTASALETFHTPFRLNCLAKRLLLTLTQERGLSRDTRVVRPLLLAAPIPSYSSGRERAAGGYAEEHENNSEMTEELGAAGTSSLAIEGGEDGKDDNEITYVMVISTGGFSGDGLHYTKAGQVFNECVEKEKDFEIPPLRTSVLRSCVYVKGRENAMHLAELMHLRALEV